MRFSNALPLALLICAVLGCATSNPVTAGATSVYVVNRSATAPSLDGRWNGPIWRKANTLEVSHFLPRSTSNLSDGEHRPVTLARVLYTDQGLFVHFRVRDKYVRCVATEYRGRVWEDAAAEFFVQPRPDRGYFNFEINCGGAMLLSYHENPRYQGPSARKDGGVPWDLASKVPIYHSMPSVVDPELATEVIWQIEYFIPFALLEEYVGPLGNVAGQEWRANFYKIAENNSHPHYAAWSPILKGVTFHAPEFFGVLQFAPDASRKRAGRSH